MGKQAILLLAWVAFLSVAAGASDDVRIEGGWWAFEGDQTRLYRLAVPPDAGSRRAGLLLLLHGYNGSAEQLAGIWAGQSGADQWVLLAPQAPHKKTGPGRISTWRPSEDHNYLRRLIDQVISKHEIDKKRIAMVGYAGGANMAIRMVNENPGLFTNVALIGGGHVKKDPKAPGVGNTAVFVLGAGRDAIFSEKRIEVLAETLKGRGARVTWEIIPGADNASLINHSDRVANWLFR